VRSNTSRWSGDHGGSPWPRRRLPLAAIFHSGGRLNPLVCPSAGAVRSTSASNCYRLACALDRNSARFGAAGSDPLFALWDFLILSHCRLGRRRSSPCPWPSTHTTGSAHWPPLPGVTVIKHCSSEVKVRVLAPSRPEYSTHQDEGFRRQPTGRRSQQWLRAQARANAARIMIILQYGPPADLTQQDNYSEMLIPDPRVAPQLYSFPRA
jgi:hypothetical protein